MILILGGRKHEEKREKKKIKNDTSIRGNGKKKTEKMKIKNDAPLGMGKENGLEIMKINSPTPHPTPTFTEKTQVPNIL
jgi:hypothetical protein